ncbi:MAG: hypothetical protein ABFD10_06260 [Prolixibacteraceae bacterium]
MKRRNYIISFLFLLIIGSMAACKGDYPIDENDLLITDRSECALTSFELLGSDHRTVFVSTAVIDTVAQTVTGAVKYGTNLAKLKPSCGHSIDAIITPDMGVWTDFSDLANPREYTVVSGNRKIRKTYKIVLTVQTKP